VIGAPCQISDMNSESQNTLKEITKLLLNLILCAHLLEHWETTQFKILTFINYRQLWFRANMRNPGTGENFETF
jgi:hypothetical protein